MEAEVNIKARKLEQPLAERTRTKMVVEGRNEFSKLGENRTHRT